MSVTHGDFGRGHGRRAGNSHGGRSASVTSMEEMRIRRLRSQWFSDHGVSEMMRRRFETMTDEHQRAARDFVDRMVATLSERRSLLACQAAVDIRDDPGEFQAGHRSRGHEEQPALAHLRTFVHMQTLERFQTARSCCDALAIAQFCEKVRLNIRHASTGIVVNYESISRETRDHVLRIADEVIMATLLKWAGEDAQTPVSVDEG